MARRVATCGLPQFPLHGTVALTNALHSAAWRLAAPEIGHFGSPPRLRRGGRWHSLRRGGATGLCGILQSSASCHKLACSTRNARLMLFRSSLRPPPCRCAAHPLLMSGGEPEKVQFAYSRFCRIDAHRLRISGATSAQRVFRRDLRSSTSADSRELPWVTRSGR